MSTIWTCLVTIKTSDGQKSEDRSHLVEKAAFMIGRALEADLPLVESGVSRMHLKVEIRGSEIYIADQNSGNGTFLNGQKIPAGTPTRVRPEDIVRIGTSIQQFSFLSVPKPVELLTVDLKQASLSYAMEELALRAEKKAKENLEKELALARAEAEQIRAQAKKESEVIATRAQIEAQARKQALEADIIRLKQDADAISSQERLSASRVADDMMAEAQKRIARDFEEASAKCERLLKDAQEKSFALMSDAQKQSRDELRLAKEEATRTRAAAVEEARQIHTDAIEKNAATLTAIKDEFHAELEKKRLGILERAQFEAQQERERVIQMGAHEIDRLAQDIEKAKRDAANARERLEFDLKTFTEELDGKKRDLVADVQREHQELLKELETERGVLEAQVSGLELEISSEREKAKQDLLRDLARVRKEQEAEHEITLKNIQDAIQKAEQQKETLSLEMNALTKTNADISAEVQRLNDECIRATKELASVTKNMEAALAMINQAQDAEKRRNEAKTELASLLSRKADEEASYERDSKERKSQAVLEVDRLKRDQEAELAKTRLKAMDELKKAIEREEERYTKSKELRAIELSQRLNDRIIPELKGWIDSPDNASIQAKAAIDLAVRSVVLEQSSAINPGAIAESVAQSVAPPKKQYFQPKYVAAVCSLVIAVVAYFGNDIYAHFKADTGNSYANRKIDERRQAAIFKPAQTDEFRDSYTDNVIYMRRYLEAKTDSFNVDKWTLRLDDVALVKSMDLTEDDIVAFIGREAALVQRLGTLRAGIDAVYAQNGIEEMRKAEEEDLKIIKGILKTDANYKRIREIEKDFIANVIATEGPELRQPAEVGK